MYDPTRIINNTHYHAKMFDRFMLEDFLFYRSKYKANQLRFWNTSYSFKINTNNFLKYYYKLYNHNITIANKIHLNLNLKDINPMTWYLLMTKKKFYKIDPKYINLTMDIIIGTSSTFRLAQVINID